MKKIIGNKRVTNAPLSSFITLKKYSTKKKLQKHLLVILLILAQT